MREIAFWKYQGCGNDFLIIEEQENMKFDDLAIKMCNRNYGMGADGLLLIKEQPLSMRIINSDGTEATMCGNGIRCFIMHCWKQKLHKNSDYKILTKAGMMQGKILETSKFKVQINMGKPTFDQTKTGVKSKDKVLNYSFYLQYHIYSITTLFIGTIHTVLFVENIDDKRWIKIGHSLHKHDFFSKQTNVNFVEIVNETTIKVKTYEKGVGMTLACGTGACASAYCAYQNGFCNSRLDVLLAKDTLEIEIVDENVLMSGPAQYIGNGIYQLEDEENGCKRVD